MHCNPPTFLHVVPSVTQSFVSWLLYQSIVYFTRAAAGQQWWQSVLCRSSSTPRALVCADTAHHAGCLVH